MTNDRLKPRFRELAAGAARDAQALGRLIARLESAAGRQIDLVLLDEAPVLPASSEAFATFRNLIAHQYGDLIKKAKLKTTSRRR